MKECVHCHYSEWIVEKELAFIGLGRLGDLSLYVDAEKSLFKVGYQYGHNDLEEICSFKIKYCPKCGRELGKNEKENEK